MSSEPEQVRIVRMGRASLAVDEQDLREDEERDLGVHHLEAPLR